MHQERDTLIKLLMTTYSSYAMDERHPRTQGLSSPYPREEETPWERGWIKESLNSSRWSCVIGPNPL